MSSYSQEPVDFVLVDSLEDSRTPSRPPSGTPGARRTDTARRLMKALFQWRWSALGFFLVFFTFLMVIGFVFPPVYESSAKLFVKPGRHNRPAGLTAQGTDAYVELKMEDVVSETEILLSRPVLERVADRILASSGTEREKQGLGAMKDAFQDFCRSIGLLPTLPEREALIASLGSNIGAKLVPGTNVLELSYRLQSPKRAQVTLEFLIEEYLVEHTRVHADLQALEFFDTQAKDFKRRLDLVKDEITQFRLANDGGDLNLQRTLLLEQLSFEEGRLRSLQAFEEGEEELLAGTSVLAAEGIKPYFDKLTELRLNLTSTLLEYPPGSEEVEAVENRLEVARQDLVTQLSANKVFLEHRVSNLQERLRDIETKRADFEDMIGRSSMLESHYRQYTNKAEEERLNRAMDADTITGVRKLQDPNLPEEPAFPDKFLLALIGVFFGLPASITLALLRGYFHGRVASVEDVERVLGAPVLSSVPRITRNALRTGMPESVLRSARMVLATAAGSGAQTIHVASSTDGEGSATVAAALAEIGSKGGRPVVLATTNATRNGIPIAEGIEALDLSSLNLQGQRAAITAARDRGALVVISGEPLAAADGGVYAGMADASVFVVSGSGVHLEVARRGLRVLERFSPSVLGAVLTQRQDAIPRLLYSRV